MPLCQLADLFGGLSAFSHAQYDCYNRWLKQSHAQLSFFTDEQNSLSRGDKERSTVLAHLKGRCDKHRLGVSLTSSNGLRTTNPNNPINFWVYTPQSPLDKAPTRGV